MIISASRRTDIPAYYADWFMACVRAGFCDVPNPYHHGQVRRVDLRPEAVDAIVFWTRNPGPLMPHLQELDELGYRYYFQYTLMDNPRPLEPNAPAARASLKTFIRLAERIGPERLVWRYDPIVFTPHTDAAFHHTTYERLAVSLRSSTKRSVISIMDWYRKAERRFAGLKEAGLTPLREEHEMQAQIHALLPQMVSIARENGMEITSCAEEHDLSIYGVKAGKCVDDDLIRDVLGVPLDLGKDPNQRRACLCRVSKDIGSYDTCLTGCVYCYATRDFGLARENYVTINARWRAT